jgi:hypothetical protein
LFWETNKEYVHKGMLCRDLYGELFDDKILPRMPLPPLLRVYVCSVAEELEAKNIKGTV